MKKIALIAIMLCFVISVFGQAPHKMTYQAVVRDANNSLVINQTVGIQISILKGTTNGEVVHLERQTPTTNINGLISIIIGVEGSIALARANPDTKTASIAAIDWGADIYFIKTELDPTGGTDYTIIGITQLLSVPYALHAKTAENVSGLEKIVENGISGWRVKGRDADSYGNIGKNAIDLSFSTLSSNIFGATNNSAVAMGYITTASGVNSTAMGMGTTASGVNATAIGSHTIASGNSSIAIGRQASALGHTSTAMGFNTKAHKNNSIAFGKYTNARANNSTAMGSYTNAYGENSTAIGNHTRAHGDNSFAIGSYTTAYYDVTALGRYNVGGGNLTSWIATDPLFEIGNGTGEAQSNRSNALTILKNGTITAPSLTNNLINTAGNKALVTKEYIETIMPKTYKIGDVALGGVVIWVDETGQHGLVCSLNNLSEGVAWINDTSRFGFTLNYTNANGIGAGKLNTTMIVSSRRDVEMFTDTNFAALLCATYSKTDINGNASILYDDGGGTITISYADWYLPSIYELSLIYPNQELISAVCEANGGTTFQGGEFWSSNQYSASEAWVYYMSNNTPSSYTKSYSKTVRAVRSF